MAGDATVQVESLWTIGGQAQRQMREMHREAGSLSSAMDGIKAQMLGIGSAAAAALGIYGVGGFLKGIVGANQELEEARFSMAGLMYQAQKMGAVNAGFRDFADAQALAAQTYRDMETHAAKAIGTATDYQRAWQAVSLPIMQAGGDLKTVMEVTKLLVPTASMYNQQLDTAAFSIKQALMGMVDGRDMMLSQMGISSKMINDLARTDKAAALNVILNAMRRNTEMMGAAGDLASAKSATLEDIWLRIKREIGAPLFNELKTQMDEFANWAAAHQKEISVWAKEWGTSIRDAFVKIKDLATMISKHWDGIASTIKTVAELWLLGKFVGGLKWAVLLSKEIAATLKMAAATNIAFGTLQGRNAAGQFTKGVSGLAGVVQNVHLVGIAAGLGVVIGRWINQTAEENQQRRERALGGGEFGPDYMRFKQEKAAEALSAKSYARDVPGAITYTPREYLDLAMKDARARDTLSDWISSNESKLLREWQARQKGIDALNSFTEAMKLGTQSASWFTRAQLDLAGAGKPSLLAQIQASFKGLVPRQDFRGSRIEIKVDARHADPDRVTSMIVRHLGRLAERPTQSRNAPVFT